MQYTELCKLNKKQLELKAHECNIDSSLPRKALVNILCLALNISTSGGVEPPPVSSLYYYEGLDLHQIEILKTLGPQNIFSANVYLNKDCGCLPDLDDGTVKKYLLKTKVFSDVERKSYKLSRPFQLKRFIHTLRFGRFGSLIVARALCLPSQSGDRDDVKALFCVLDAISGIPCGGYCSCTAGYSQTCGHLGALLFVLAELVANGVKNVDDSLTCTDQICKWTNPKDSDHWKPNYVALTRFDTQCHISEKRAAVDQKPLDQIEDRTSGSFSRKNGDYGIMVRGQATSQPPGLQQILKLRQDLFNATQNLGLHVPAVHALQPSRFQTGENIKIQTVETMPDLLEFNSELLAPAYITECESLPLPIVDLPTHFGMSETDIHNFINQSYTSEDINRIERMTRGQRSNLQWFKKRMGCISSTLFRDVTILMGPRSRINKERIVKRVIGKEFYMLNKIPPLPNKEPLRWGITKENVARKEFALSMAQTHSNFIIQESGLLVHDKYKYVRASPDGISSCDCHGKCLLEIKCPWTARDMIPDEALAKLRYLENVNGNYSLKAKCSQGYYEQVQGAMALSRTDMCYFVIWTTRGHHTIEVSFDQEYWETVLSSVVQFYIRHIIPVFSNFEVTVSSDEESDVELSNSAGQINEENAEESDDDHIYCIDSMMTAPLSCSSRSVQLSENGSLNNSGESLNEWYLQTPTYPADFSLSKVESTDINSFEDHSKPASIGQEQIAMTVVKLENDYDEDKENVDKNDIDACNHINCRLPRKKKISWVQCDKCDKWYHTVCVSRNYQEMRKKESTFYCGCS